MCSCAWRDQEANFSICILFEKRQGLEQEERAYLGHWNAEKVVSLGIEGLWRETKKMGERFSLGICVSGGREMEGEDGLRD